MKDDMMDDYVTRLLLIAGSTNKDICIMTASIVSMEGLANDSGFEWSTHTDLRTGSAE